MKGQSVLESTEPQSSETVKRLNHQDLSANSVTNTEALSPAEPTQNINAENTIQHSNKHNNDLTELKEAINQTNAMFAELQDNHESVNRALEDLGEISPRELAEYISEPFDLLIARLKEEQYEAFEAFFRSTEQSAESLNYERLIRDFYANQKSEQANLLHKVDCRLKECKVFLYSVNKQYFEAALKGISGQPWATDLTLNGFNAYPENVDGETRLALIFSYLLPTSLLPNNAEQTPNE